MYSYFFPLQGGLCSPSIRPVWLPEGLHTDSIARNAFFFVSPSFFISLGFTAFYLQLLAGVLGQVGQLSRETQQHPAL